MLVGANYPKESPCTRSFSSNDNDPSKLSIDIECGRQRNHDWNHYGYNLGADCINMTAYKRSGPEVSTISYKFRNLKKISCLEDYNYNFDSNESPHNFLFTSYDYNDVELVTKRGLLEFLTYYWLNPSITEVTCSRYGKNVKTDAIALTRLKLINLFRHFSENKDEQSSIGLNHRKKSAYILDAWYWDKNYKSLINIYDRNKEFFDLFLPIVKLLDDDEAIRLTVDFLINSRDKPDMRIPKFAERESSELLNECDQEYFTVTNNEVVATVRASPNSYVISRSFWERRRNDETDEITLELLKKIKDVLN